MDGDPKILKVGHVTPSRPLWPIFHCFLVVTHGVHLHAKFQVSSFYRSWDTEGSQNSKIGSREPLVTAVDIIFHFFPLVPLGVHLHAKFRVSSFYRSRDTDGVPKLHIWVTWPLTISKQEVVGNPIFGFADPDLPIHYTTFIGLRWRLRVVCRWAWPLLRPFLADFWSKIWLGHVTPK